MVAAIYSAICWAVGDGLDLAAKEGKDLLTYIVGMYAIAFAVSVIARYERVQRREAVARTQQIQRERIELSHTIHDTVGQSAYMIGMGIDNAQALAGASNPQLTSSLEATGKLARSAMWSLRHPIDIGVLFDGQGLGTTLSSHAAAFASITSIPAEVRHVGAEPLLSVATRSLLFSIAHNALTNVFRHGEAPCEATVGEDAELDFRHIQPAAMLGRVVKFQPLGDAPGFRRRKGLIQRRLAMGIESLPHT